MKQNNRPADHLAELLLDRMVALVHLKGQHLTLRQLAILFLCVDAEEPQTVGSLTQRLTIARSIVSHDVTRLAAANLVKRKPDPNDRRSAFIVASLAGRKFYDWFVGEKVTTGAMARKG